MAEKEPKQRTPKGLEIPVPKRAAGDAMLDKAMEPQRDGPHEVEDAARQEVEYPADETDEG
ncbi:MAG TPA: hypothetical protein VIK54_01570 [Acidimicrobiia bacterium]